MSSNPNEIPETPPSSPFAGRDPIAEIMANIARSQNLDIGTRTILEDSYDELGSDTPQEAIDVFELTFGLQELTEREKVELVRFSEANAEFFRREFLRALYVRGRMPIYTEQDKIAVAFQSGLMAAYEILMHKARENQPKEIGHNRRT
jgi:hypothetical protein